MDKPNVIESQKPDIEAVRKMLKDAEDNAVSDENDFVLSKREAEAASPGGMAVGGEEDPGEGLEFLVSEDADDDCEIKNEK